MLSQYVQALSGMLAPCLLVMCLSVLLNVGEGRDKPVSAHWRLYGLLVGLAASVVFAVLRTTAVVNRRSTVNLPTLVACVLLDIAVIVVVLKARRVTDHWHEKPRALDLCNALAALAIAFTVFYAVPDVILQLTSFVETGDSPFTSAMLMRALGFLLGIGTAVVVAAIFRTLSSTATTRAFMIAALLVVIINLIHHTAELFALLMNMRILVLSGVAFRTLILVRNHTLQLTIAQAVVFLIPAIASIVVGFRTPKTGENEAIARSHLAFRRRSKTTAAFSILAIAAVAVSLIWGTAELNKVPTLSEPEAYAMQGETITIPFTQVSDGHLHRFEYTAKDGTVMRFIIIKKNGGAYGIGLDACETCGDAGYYEKNGKIICKRCDVAINLATIGFKGGCNPIPFDYVIANSAITIQTTDLDALSAHFK